MKIFYVLFILYNFSNHDFRRQEQLARKQMMEEQLRLESEREEREKRRQQSEIQLIRDRHLKEKMQQISQTAHGQKVLKKLDEEVFVENCIDNLIFYVIILYLCILFILIGHQKN